MYSYLFNLFIALGRLIANITHLFTLQRACLLALLSPRVRMSKQAHADPDACAAVIAEPAQLHRMWMCSMHILFAPAAEHCCRKIPQLAISALLVRIDLSRVNGSLRRAPKNASCNTPYKSVASKPNKLELLRLVEAILWFSLQTVGSLALNAAATNFLDVSMLYYWHIINAV